MFKLKKILAILLVASLMLSNLLPSLAESSSKEENETSVTSEVTKEVDSEVTSESEDDIQIEDLETEKDETAILNNNSFDCKLRFIDTFNGYIYYNTSVKEGVEIEVSTYNGFIKSQNSNTLKNKYFLTWTDDDGNVYKDGDSIVIEKSYDFLIDYTYARRLIVGLPETATLDLESIEGAYVYEDRILYVDPDTDIILPTAEQIDLHDDNLEFLFWTTDKEQHTNENDYSREETIYAGTQDVEIYGILRVTPQEEDGSYDFTMPSNWFMCPLYANSGEFIHKSKITKVTFDNSDSEPDEYDAYFYVNDEKISRRRINCFVVNENELIIYLGDKITTLYTPEDASEFFSGFEAVKEYENINLLNTSKTTNFQSFFYNNKELTSLDLSSFDTSNATNMVMMFNKCSSLENLDIQNFDTSNVTDMNLMFASASALKELDITSFSAESLENAPAMFANMLDIEKIYASNNFDLSTKGNKIGNIQVSENENLTGTYGFDTAHINNYIENHSDIVLYSNAFARLDKNSKNINERGIFTDKNVESPEAVDVEAEEEVNESETNESENDYRRYLVKGLKGSSKIVDDLSKLEGVLYYKDNYLYVKKNVRAKLPRGAEIDFNSFYYGWSGWYTGPEGTGKYITHIEADWKSESIILYAYMPEQEFDTDPIDLKDDECLVTFYDRFGFFNYNYNNRGIYQVVKKGNKVDFPEEGNNPGWKFKGWFLIDTSAGYDWWIDKNDPYDIDIPVNENSCFCAYWEEIEYPIVWHSEEVQLTDVLYENYSTKTYNQTISLILSERDEDLGHGFGDWWFVWDDAYDFLGFYKDPNFKVQIFELPSNEEGPYHIYVKWKLATVEVEFKDRNKGTWTEQVVYGSKITVPEVPGEGFKHWYLVFSLDDNGNTRTSLPEIPFDFNTIIRGRKYKLESVYEGDDIPIRLCGFRYITDYGTAPYDGNEIEVRIGEKVENPGPPTNIENVKGLRFSHWYLRRYLEDDMSQEAQASRLKPFDFDAIITDRFWDKDVNLLWTLKAYWVEVDEDETEEETTVAPPEVKTYSVVFELNGGVFKNGFDQSIYNEVEVNTQINLPEASLLEKEGYTFKGWYKNADLTGSDIKGVKLTEEGSITLYAKWEKNPTYYSVVFNLNNGEFNSGYNLSIFNNVKTGTQITLPVGTDMKYVSTADVEAEFAGWYRESDFSGERVYKVGSNDEGTVNIYAKWNITEYVTIEIGPSLRYKYLAETYTGVPSYSSIFVGGTNVKLRVKKGDKITVPPLNNATHFRTYNVDTHNDEWTGFVTQSYMVMRKSNLRVSYINYQLYPGDEFEVLEDGLIMYAGSGKMISGKTFTRQEIIKQYGEPIYEEIGSDQPFASKSTPKSTSTPTSTPKSLNNGGGSGGSGGGGGGGGGGGSLQMSNSQADAMNGPGALNQAQPLNNNLLNQTPQAQPQATNAVTNQSDAKQASGNSFLFDSSLSSWTQNTDGTWSMSISVAGQNINANSGFYNMVQQDATTGAQTNAVYYFDEKGQMATGWVKDANNNYYFFETTNNNNVGKMTTGWREINGSSYYFGADGKMVSNSITPDGKFVGADGKVLNQ